MDTSKPRDLDWSKLCPDILRKIFETLIPVDSHRAKTVCLGWYSVWKTCANRPRSRPWRIIHQGESSNLFDPDEDKVYTRKLVEGLSGDYRMASYGNWLLMLDDRTEFYLLNLLTFKKIKLPSMEEVKMKSDEKCGLLVKTCRKHRRLKDIIGWENLSEDIREWKSSAVLWIDDKTGDYVVAWIFRQQFLFSYKKGDVSWIFDFSRGNPNEEVAGIKNPYWYYPFRFVEQPWEYIWRRKIAIRNSGEVLIILSLKEKEKYENEHEERLLFHVFRMNRKSGKWERVYSIKGEMLVFGHGVTVRAPVEDCFGDGIKSGSICFVDDDVWPDHQDHDRRASDCGVFDLATSRIEWRKRLCVYINKTQWFAPGVAY
ncbi:unnamed protein product [Microthlaspi erraticum]|uniref:DUF295 domain-containing protein n=1 Tax=Microthlaspi erraticum TaxID=1685480 RepID=A0A6D2K6K9_9BRAS|nr:unnamed protein product [Microthlaspi erraticum]